MRSIRNKFYLMSLISILAATGTALAVNSKVVRHSTAAAFLKGKTENTIIDSDGTIRLAWTTETLDSNELFKDVWAVNAMVIDDAGAVYLGTSPNGDIFRFKDNEFARIYPLDPNQSDNKHDNNLEQDKTPDPNTPQAKFTFRNEHIFAITTDAADRVLAGISGSRCALLRFDEQMTPQIIFEPDKDLYIHAIVLDEMGNIYLGTGPFGRIYRLDPFGKDPTLIYETKDKNVMSLAVDSAGFIYAGSDQRGLVYKIDQTTGSARVLFDTEQEEITSLLLDENQNIYAASTSAQAIKASVKSSAIAADSNSGKPQTKEPDDNKDTNKSSTTIKTANTGSEKLAAKSTKPPETKRGLLPKTAGHIYKITPEGFVTDIFGEMAVFFDMKEQNGIFLLATGNEARLLSIDPQTEEKAIIYQDQQASQITSIAITDNLIYLGCANPPKIIKLTKQYSPEGTYTSELLDASQPAKWGKLQIDAQIPAGAEILVAARSGNVSDPNDPTFSQWTEPAKITDPVQLNCPNARFCQYRLTLRSNSPDTTPTINEVTVAHVIPNLPPKINSVEAEKSKDKNKPGVFDITCKARDDNGDSLLYQIDFRKIGQSTWIKLKDKLNNAKFEWDTNTVEDGRYEIRVTADDRQNNSPAGAMTDARISDAFVVDNTPPVITSQKLDIVDDSATITLTVEDEFTVVGQLSYTVNSSEDWNATLPDDMVYDTTSETFELTINDLEKGGNIIALKISDDLGNTMYKTYQVDIK